MLEQDNFELFAHAFRQTAESIIITDARADDHPITYANPAFENLTGYNVEEILGKNCRFMQGKNRDEAACATIRENMAEGKVVIVTLPNVRKDGSTFWNELSISPMRLEGETITHFISVLRDVSHHVSDKKALQSAHEALQKSLAELNQLVISDPLTGIYNRRHFSSILEREWQICRREKDPISLALIDIDHFKNFNDEHGHQAGDEALMQVAKRIQAGFNRGNDLVARYGGEEFVVLCPRMSLEDAAAQLQRVCESIHNAEITLVSGAARLSVSAGLASVVPGTGTSQSALFKLADERLYSAKQGGRNRVVASGTT